MTERTKKVVYLPQTVSATGMWNYISPTAPEDEPAERFLKQIESAGRICYKSEHKIGEGTALPFVKHVIARKHFSVTEFGTLDVRLPLKDGKITPYAEKAEQPIPLDYAQWCLRPTWSHFIPKGDHVVLSTSLRELLVSHYEQNPTKAYDMLGVLIGCTGEGESWIETIDLLEWLLQDINDNYADKYYINPSVYAPDVLSDTDMGNYEAAVGANFFINTPLRLMYHATTSRAVTHELVRHRLFSFLQESQRYVRYTDALPVIDFQDDIAKCEDGQVVTEKLNSFFETTADLYTELIRDHKLAQQIARLVLPNQTKTEILFLGYFDYVVNWFLPQRNSEYALPAMQRLASQVSAETSRQLASWLRDKGATITAPDDKQTKAFVVSVAVPDQDSMYTALITAATWKDALGTAYDNPLLFNEHFSKLHRSAQDVFIEAFLKALPDDVEKAKDYLLEATGILFDVRELEDLPKILDGDKKNKEEV